LSNNSQMPFFLFHCKWYVLRSAKMLAFKLTWGT